MNDALSHFFRLLLILSLALYGAVAVAGSNDAGVYVEICADGVVKNVRIDAAGNALDPAHDCNDCVKCCLHISDNLKGALFQSPIFAPHEIKPDFVSSQVFVFQKRGFGSNPRGPPATDFSNLIVNTGLLSGLKTHCDRFPYLKDAAA